MCCVSLSEPLKITVVGHILKREMKIINFEMLINGLVFFFWNWTLWSMELKCNTGTTLFTFSVCFLYVSTLFISQEMYFDMLSVILSCLKVSADIKK